MAAVRERKPARSVGSKGKAKDTKTSTTSQEPVLSDAIKLLQSDNPFIWSGFRDYTEGSFMECSKSVFHVHNDTMNIWTHLIGGFWAIIAICDVLFSPATNHGSFSDKLIFFLFLACTTACFCASAAYHVYRSHSVEMYKIFLVYDVGAIAFQLFGSVMLMAYFEMSCHSRLRSVWLISLVSLFIITVGSVPYLMRHRRYNIRTLLLSTFALSGLVSHFQRMAFEGFHYSSRDVYLLRHLLLSYVLPAVGLVIRRVKIPEYWFPGKFDIWCGSHQIFHIMVGLGPWILYNGYRHVLTGEARICT